MATATLRIVKPFVSFELGYDYPARRHDVKPCEADLAYVCNGWNADSTIARPKKAQLD